MCDHNDPIGIIESIRIEIRKFRNSSSYGNNSMGHFLTSLFVQY